MTKFKTIDGERYQFAGSKKTNAEAENQADKYRAQGRLCQVLYEVHTVTRHDVRAYAIYTRSK